MGKSREIAELGATLSAESGSVIFGSDVGTTSAIPAPSSSLIKGEISARNGGISSGADGGLLRLSAGGGTNVDQKAIIDLNGYTNQDDNCAIRMVTGGVENFKLRNDGHITVAGATNSTAILNFPEADSGEVLNIYSSPSQANRTGLGKYSSEFRSYVPSGDIFSWVTGGPSGTQRMKLNSANLAINHKLSVNLPAVDAVNYSAGVGDYVAQIHGRVRSPGFNVGNYSTLTWADLGSGGETDGMFTRAEGQCYISVDDIFRIRDNTSGTTENKRFEFNTDTGTAGADNSWASGAFDFAEMFEWADGNPNEEDRIGYSVALVEGTGKIKIAEHGDTPIGIVSGTAAFVGDSGFMGWSKMYVTDEWGRVQYDYLYNEDGTPQLNKYGEHARTKRLNPEYDPALSYVQRSKRPEWATVGLLGKVMLREGSPTHSNWVKLKNMSEGIDIWLIK